MAKDTTSEVYAVLVALQGGTLLMPNAAVAEVVSHDGLQPAASGPDWLIGSYLWNGRKVTVVSFEAINGAPKPELARRARLVVLNSVSPQLGGGQIALLSQGYPHLITLNRAAVQKIPLLDSDRDELVLTRVRIANTEAAIPDLAAVEQQVAQLQSAQQAA